MAEHRHYGCLGRRAPADEQQANERGEDDGLLAQYGAQRSAAARDAHLAHLGRQQEPQAAAEQEDTGDDHADHRGDLDRHESDDDRAGDPDDLLCRRVERKQPGKPGRGDHLRVDGSNRWLHRGSAETAEESDRHVDRHRHREKGDREDGRRTDQRGQDEHWAHPPPAHPPARERPGYGLADARGGQNKAGVAVGMRNVLHPQQVGQREHAVRQPGGELRGDDARYSGSSKEAPVCAHKRPILDPRLHAAPVSDGANIVVHRVGRNCVELGEVMHNCGRHAHYM